MYPYEMGSEHVVCNTLKWRLRIEYKRMLCVPGRNYRETGSNSTVCNFGQLLYRQSKIGVSWINATGATRSMLKVV